MPALAPGYLLTWHTYGTWLHGDDAGSVATDHNRFGSPRLAPDAAAFSAARQSLKDPPLVLSRLARILMDKVMRDHCRIRDWDLRALAVRSNHIHAVIRAPPVKPESMVKQLKEWGTRKLREHRIVGASQRVWADHGSTIYLFEPGSLENAIRYVLEMQEDPPDGHGRPDWQSRYGLKEP